MRLVDYKNAGIRLTAASIAELSEREGLTFEPDSPAPHDPAAESPRAFRAAQFQWADFPWN